MESLNLKLFFWLNQGAGQQPVVDEAAVLFAESGPYLLVLALAIFWYMANDQRRYSLLEATETGIVGLLINQLLGLMIYHPRPYMVGLVEPLVAHGPENSFPSDHATLMLTVAFYLLCRQSWRRQGFILLIFALATAWGRIYAGLHFPLDMFASFVVAVFSSGMVLWQRQILKPFNQLLIQTDHQINNWLLHKMGKPVN